VQRCKHIIDGVLDFSRPKSATKESVDVNAVIEQTVFLIKHHARFKTIQLHTLFDASIDKLQGSAEQLIQVFMALLINAADAMNEKGSITIRTRRGIAKSEGLIAEVIDEGHGIARTDLPKIFEPFYTTKPPGRGTGLGLSICYSIIAEHGGRIEVDSALGAGSTFRITFPTANGVA
jgi:signal transduction histidine kinase